MSPTTLGNLQVLNEARRDGIRLDLQNNAWAVVPYPAPTPPTHLRRSPNTSNPRQNPQQLPHLPKRLIKPIPPGHRHSSLPLSEEVYRRVPPAEAGKSSEPKPQTKTTTPLNHEQIPSPARRERARVRVTGVDKRAGYGKQPPTNTWTTTSIFRCSKTRQFRNGLAQRDLCKTSGFPPLAGEMSEGQRGPPTRAGLLLARPLRFSVRGREQAKRCERGMQETRGQTDSPSLILQTTTTPTRNETATRRGRS